MATVRVSGLEDSLRSILRGIFGVHPTKVDPALYGSETDAPNPTDFQGYDYGQAMANIDSSPNELELAVDTAIPVIKPAAPGWSGYSITIPSGSITPVRVASQNLARRSIFIRNLGNLGALVDGSVVIGASQNVSRSVNAGGGFLLTNYGFGFVGAWAPTDITLETTGEVWAILAETNLATTTYLQVVEILDAGGGKVT